MFIPTKTLKNGMSIPNLGLGTWMMGGDENKMISPQDDIDVSILSQALDNGFSHIDTAEKYANGYTEELVSRAINIKPRESLFLASKASKGNHTKNLLSRSLDETLKRLGTDYLDLYYLHQRTPETPFEETAEALNRAHQAGKIKNIGVCNFSKESFDELQKYLKPKIFANQVHYNLAFREPETSGLINHAKEKGYFIVAWRPLKLVKRNVDTPSVQHNIWESGAFPILDKMSEKYKVTNVQIALSWVTHHPHVVTLVKSSNLDHLIEASKGVSINLSDTDYKTLSENFFPQYQSSDSIALN
jgi:diketogulonate reductase-like aldo/keto reductase